MTRSKILSLAIFAVVTLGIGASPSVGFSQTPPTNHFVSQADFNSATPEMAALGSRGIHVHDPSTIIKCKDEYWVFYTGRGIPSYHSKDLIHWEEGPHIFTNVPSWTIEAVPEHHGNYYWAPDVIHLGDRYLLYYSVSTFGKKVSAIGLVTNPTLDPNDPKFAWTDQGEVIRSTSTNNFNTIDPAVSQDANGKLWLCFGSYWSGIKLTQLDDKTGKRISPDSQIYSLAHNDSIEASCIYHHDDYYYLFVNWGSCCKGVNSTYNIRVGRSKEITGPYLDHSGVDLMKSGGSLFLGSQGPFIGPGHAGFISQGSTNWFSCHFYDGSRAGLSTLAVLPLRWGTNDWPEIVHNAK